MRGRQQLLPLLLALLALSPASANPPCTQLPAFVARVDCGGGSGGSGTCVATCDEGSYVDGNGTTKAAALCGPGAQWSVEPPCRPDLCALDWGCYCPYESSCDDQYNDFCGDVYGFHVLCDRGGLVGVGSDWPGMMPLYPKSTTSVTLSGLTVGPDLNFLVNSVALENLNINGGTLARLTQYPAATPNLARLLLKNNRITIISSVFFGPLLSQLVELDLSFNPLRDLPVDCFSHLQNVSWI
jgi:Leucine-rich repeat (LRR) protein